MPGAINCEPSAPQAGSHNMGMMMLKKRKRDVDSGQDSNMLLSTPSQFTSNSYPRTESFSVNTSYSRTNTGSPTSTPANHRSRIRPLIPLKKRRLDPKGSPVQSSQPLFLYPCTQQGGQQQEWAEHRNSHSLSTTPSTTDDYIMKNMGDIPRQIYRYQDDEYDRFIPERRQQTSSSSIKAATRGDKQTLAPCHICHRRPTTRTLLDAYADCEICNERSCYVCLRECNDISCCEREEYTDSGAPRRNEQGGSMGRKICSSCAVEGILETGEEVVRCLVCVERG